jgi:hypothetical protein
MTTTQYLPGQDKRAQHMRLDIAKTLKRFYFCERQLIVAQAAWLPGVANLDTKLALPYMFWQDAMTGDACRNRVFELRYPSRILEIDEDAPLITSFTEAINAPNDLAFLQSLTQVYKPALLQAYKAYLEVADDLADGPSIRFMEAAVRDKEKQIARLTHLTETVSATKDETQKQAAKAWVESLNKAVSAVGGVSFETPKKLSENI